MKKYTNRNEVPEKYKMNVSDYYKSSSEWNEMYQKISSSLPTLREYEGKLHTASELENYLQKSIDINSDIVNLYIYAMVNHDLDLKNDEYSEMHNKASALFSKASEFSAFAIPELLTLNENQFSELFIQNSNLNKYRVYLENIYEEKAHVLNKSEEEILAVLTETFDSYQTLSSSLINLEHDYGTVEIDGKSIQISSNNYRALMKNRDENIRKIVREKYYGKLAEYKYTAAILLNAFVRNNINLAKIRKYNSPWEEKLKDEHLPNELFVSLKEAASEMADANENYFKLMQKALKVDKLHVYDESLDWSEEKETFTIEEAIQTIKTALNIRGPSYQEKLSQVFDNHDIDFCQYKGKVSGGYCISSNDGKSSKIVLSFNDDYESVSTIAHEAGHSVHYKYISSNNPTWYTESSTFCTEVASLTNEFLLNNYLAKNSSNKVVRLKAIENTLKTFQSNFFGAIYEGELEEEMYKYAMEGNTINANYLCDTINKLFMKYKEYIDDDDKYFDLMWVRRSHYYMPFYLYSYAVCASVAATLADKISSGNKDILEKYEKFLSCGDDLKPTEIYQKLDIDITDKKVFENAIEYFQKQIDLYESLMK